MSLIPEDMQLTGSNKFLKGTDFEGAGQTLEVDSFEIITPENEEFGAQDSNWLVKEGKLKLGQSIRYSFKSNDEAGKEKIFETTSPGFFIGFNSCNPDKGDVITIKRTGKAAKTRYEITK